MPVSCSFFPTLRKWTELVSNKCSNFPTNNLLLRFYSYCIICSLGVTRTRWRRQCAFKMVLYSIMLDRGIFKTHCETYKYLPTQYDTIKMAMVVNRVTWLLLLTYLAIAAPSAIYPKMIGKFQDVFNSLRV